MVIKAGVRPLLVFDGASLVMKAGTNEKRAIRRKECLAKALELHNKKKFTEAYKFFT